MILDDCPVLHQPPFFNQAKMFFMISFEMSRCYGKKADWVMEDLTKQIEDFDESRDTRVSRAASGPKCLNICPQGSVWIRIDHARSPYCLRASHDAVYDNQVMFGWDVSGGVEPVVEQMRARLKTHVVATLPQIMSRADEVWRRSVWLGLRDLLLESKRLVEVHAVIKGPITDIMKTYGS